MRSMELLLVAVALIAAGTAVGGPDLVGGIDDPRAIAARTSQAAATLSEAGVAESPHRSMALPRARTATSVSEGRPPEPFGNPGADGEVDEPVGGHGADIPLDLDPNDRFDPVIISPEGFRVVPGTAEAGSGPRVAYTVEVEPSLGIDPLAVAAVVEAALHDPRSWMHDATLERVDDIDAAAIRVVLAEPATVDELCGQAQLDTGGRFSCWNGTFAALNAMRWEEGAPDFDDLTTYRRYLVNHEFGHGLGHGHQDCGTPGALAPVMMQQTKGTGGCEANGWPYPEFSPP